MKKHQDFIQLLRKHKLRVFTTSDILTLTGISPPVVTRALTRLSRQGHVVRLKKGVWVNAGVENVNPYEAVPYLRSPWASYVSLTSALSDHGLIAEIPQIITAVTAALPIRFSTKIGTFQFHHLPSHLMWGFELNHMGPAQFPLADPEKAFLDQVYLHLIPRSPIQMPPKRTARWSLNTKKLKAYSKQFKSRRLMEYLKRNGIV